LPEILSLDEVTRLLRSAVSGQTRQLLICEYEV
jgi:hypothetical protein